MISAYSISWSDNLIFYISTVLKGFIFMSVSKIHCKIVAVPFASWNVPTVILVRPLAIVEHSVVSVASIRDGFTMAINRYKSLHQFARGPCDDIF